MASKSGFVEVKAVSETTVKISSDMTGGNLAEFPKSCFSKVLQKELTKGNQFFCNLYYDKCELKSAKFTGVDERINC